MSRKTLLKGLTAMLLAAVVMVALPGLVQAAGRTIKISGSTTVLPIGQKAAEVFMKIHPGVRISVAGTGSGDGIKGMLDKTNDIAMSSRGLKGREIKLAAKRGFKPVKHVVGLDCIVPVVHPGNPVKNLTVKQLRDIYTGKIKTWKAVGGWNKPIVVISRDSSSGTFEVWHKKVLHKKRVRRDAQLQASNGAVAQAVAGNKYALGYVGIGYLNPKLKALTVSGVKASPQTAMSGKYPVARQLYMFTRGAPTGVAKQFLDFVKGPQGKKIVKAEGFIPVK